MSKFHKSRLGAQNGHDSETSTMQGGVIAPLVRPAHLAISTKKSVAQIKAERIARLAEQQAEEERRRKEEERRRREQQSDDDDSHHDDASQNSVDDGEKEKDKDKEKGKQKKKDDGVVEDTLDGIDHGHVDDDKSDSQYGSGSDSDDEDDENDAQKSVDDGAKEKDKDKEKGKQKKKDDGVVEDTLDGIDHGHDDDDESHSEYEYDEYDEYDEDDENDAQKSVDDGEKNKDKEKGKQKKKDDGVVEDTLDGIDHGHVDDDKSDSQYGSGSGSDDEDDENDAQKSVDDGAKEKDKDKEKGKQKKKDDGVVEDTLDGIDDDHDDDDESDAEYDSGSGSGSDADSDDDDEDNDSEIVSDNSGQKSPVRQTRRHQQGTIIVEPAIIDENRYYTLFPYNPSLENNANANNGYVVPNKKDIAKVKSETESHLGYFGLPQSKRLTTTHGTPMTTASTIPTSASITVGIVGGDSDEVAEVNRQNAREAMLEMLQMGLNVFTINDRDPQIAQDKIGFLMAWSAYMDDIGNKKPVRNFQVNYNGKVYNIFEGDVFNAQNEKPVRAFNSNYEQQMHWLLGETEANTNGYKTRITLADRAWNHNMCQHMQVLGNQQAHGAGSDDPYSTPERKDHASMNSAGSSPSDPSSPSPQGLGGLYNGDAHGHGVFALSGRSTSAAAVKQPRPPRKPGRGHASQNGRGGAKNSTF